ncbi:YfhO family protein [Peterkaempfera sp. SMS 1(5)a]|uniref:YfhO family protein n=1 Tax=Peterkaempfera podocarpi TaxID=3232308 RepID=UPI00366EF70B
MTPAGTAPAGSAPAAAEDPRRARRRATGTAVALSALLTALGLCLGDALARMYPFGPATRSVSDLGNQYVPFYARWWDVLHGHGQGDLLINWNSGYGTSYLPDVGTYLASPFSPLVALFPRDRVDLAVYVITVLMTATAAAAMTGYLLRLRRGNPVLAACFGTAYGLCGFAVTDAAYNPMWLTGLIALPLLFLGVEWALEGRRPVLGALLVTAAWAANFYTAYMAVLGSLVVLAVRLAQTPAPWRARAAAVLRLGVRTGLGIGAAAPLFLVVYTGTRYVWPIAPRDFHAVPWSDVLARSLPTTYGFNSPGLYIGTFALLAALAMPFDRRISGRIRATWCVAAGAVLLSLQWGPTVLVWYAFTNPNGSSYRQAFVLCALLVTAGWLSFSRGLPDRRTLLCAAGVLAAVAAGSASSGLDIRWTLPVLGGSVVIGGLLYLLRRHAQRRGMYRLAAATLALLPVLQVGEAAVDTARVDRNRLHHLDSHPAWGPWQDQVRQAVTASDDWPRSRTEAGSEMVTANDPQLLGGQGAEYYSSLTSEAWISTMAKLGYGWTSRGRAPRTLDNPVTDAVFSVGTRVRAVPHPSAEPYDASVPATVTVSHQKVPPLVTVRPAGPAPRYGNDTFRNQEMLLGATVYAVPDARVVTRDGRQAQRTADGWRADPQSGSKALPSQRITVACRPGWEVFLNTPHFGGTAAMAQGSTVRMVAAPGTQVAAMQRLGVVPADGRVQIDLRAAKPGSLPLRPVGCLDPSRLAAAVGQLSRTGATQVSVSGHGLHAELPAGSVGTAVVAVPRTKGWQCAAGDAALRPAQQYGGLLAVPLDGRATTVDCSFTPPGLKAGAALGTGSLLLLGAAGLWSARRRRAGRLAL